jgi:predicted branched-subunit amino acid permease
MSVVEAVAMTLFVYAGSSQLAAIPLIVAGAPAWVIWATGFCVNLRFVVFSLHLRPT